MMMMMMNVLRQFVAACPRLAVPVTVINDERYIRSEKISLKRVIIDKCCSCDVCITSFMC